MYSVTDANLTALHVLIPSILRAAYKESTIIITIIIFVFQMRKLSLSNMSNVTQVVSDKVQAIYLESLCFDSLSHSFIQL